MFSTCSHYHLPCGSMVTKIGLMIAFVGMNRLFKFKKGVKHSLGLQLSIIIVRYTPRQSSFTKNQPNSTINAQRLTNI